jgi:SAM-dependent methyltransferase
MNIGKYYFAESYWGDNLQTTNSVKDIKKDREYNYGFLYNTIFSHKKKGAILDIGAGTGLFLSAFKDKKWDTSGVEFSKDAVKFAKKMYGLSIKQGDLMDIKFKEQSFDVVTMNNVLEHLYDPKKTLEKVDVLLKPKGIVVITVPNIYSLGSILFKKRWYALQIPRHLYHFSPRTVTKLLKDAGFTVDTISFNYKLHNYFTLFESFRYLLSPRFQSSDKKGLAVVEETTTPSLKKTIGKYVFSSLSLLLSTIEPFIGKGEVMTIYARKTT